jgi:hypothetical protein
MSELRWIHSHVRHLLGELWSTDAVDVDEDGDFPFRGATAMCWVRVVPSTPPMVRVWAHAALEVRRSAALLTELNEIASGTLSVSVYWDEGTVVVQQTVSPVELGAPVLGQAVRSVSSVADDVGPLIAASFGGRTPFLPQIDPARDEVPPDRL